MINHLSKIIKMNYTDGPLDELIINMFIKTCEKKLF